MWQAYESLQKRWQKQKLNRTLRIRIAKLSKGTEAYAHTLAKKQWCQVCDQTNSKLGLEDHGNYYTQLLDPENTKLAHRKNIARLMHECALQDDELIHAEELRLRHVDISERVTLPKYEGTKYPYLDEENEK